MEGTYTSEENGGNFEINYIPELTDVANENINFSKSDKVGGAIQTYGVGWTVAGMVATTSGVPLKIPVGQNEYTGYGTFLPGITNLGDILEEEGYNQEIIMGSLSSFGGRETYFKTHGDYTVKDINTSYEDGITPKDYSVFWGFEDSKLFNYAKKELETIEEPFNLTLLTENTHFPDGYLEGDCAVNYETNYENVIACESIRVVAFLEYLKTLDIYDNTVIILTGDHLSMNGSLFTKIANDTERQVYNAFINVDKEPVQEKNRLFTQMDIFPSILSAMNVEIEGDRIGLGTDLFSNEDTLAEEYNAEELHSALEYNSDFYNETFLTDMSKFGSQI
jgi:phosphoglycerol transferase